MNRIGIWKADSESDFKQWKLHCNIYEAQIGERLVKQLATVTASSGNTKYPSDERIKRNILLDPVVKNNRSKLYRLEKEHQYMESFYWSIKEKAGKLNRISESMNLSPIEFEQNIIETSINGYLITKKNRIMKLRN